MSDTKQDQGLTTFTLEQINTAVEQLVKNQHRAAQSVATLLTMAVYGSIVGVAGSHVSVANTIIKVLRKSTKRDAIVAFLEHYGQLAFVDQTFQHFTVTEAAKALKWTKEYVELVKLAANDWESFRKPAVEQELDIEAAVQMLLTKSAKAQKNNKVVKNAELNAFLVDALARYHAKQVA